MAFWPTGSASKKRLWHQTGLRAFQAVVVAALLMATNAQAKPVAIELVLALDSSASVERKEFKLQLKGLARAFADPDVAKAVANLAPLGVSVALMQWGGAGETRVIIPFTVLKSKADAIVFGFRVGRSHRRIRATDTSIATAITDSHALLDTNDFEGQRSIIDISGDGPDNSGIDVEAARQAANLARITINGLPIEADEKTVTTYYRERVIIGADSFIEPAKDFDDYARAIKAKLLRELQPLAS